MTGTQPGKRPLDEVMLAMDVVDTLRHRQLLVEQELHAEDRDQKLIERLRELYASQGIEVPDQVLAEGVAALNEDRFLYQPPRGGLSVALARMYIERGKWAKRGGIVAIVLALLGSGYHFLVTGPAERRLNQQVTELNSDIQGGINRLDVLELDVKRLDSTLPHAGEDSPEKLSAAVETKRTAAAQALREARSLIGSARELALRPDIEQDSYELQGDGLRHKLTRQEELIDRAAGSVNKAENALVAIASLSSLPQQLKVQRDAVVGAAKVDQATQRGKQAYETGMTAMHAGDVEAATAAVDSLRRLHERLLQDYELRIVSRPNERSGVWRVPERNPNARNYYIIVEAVAPGGTVLSQPITNEEDGKTYNVDQWGLRVDERVFKRIAADKDDDGIIQNRRFGVKRPGYLEPEYLIPSTGAAISAW